MMITISTSETIEATTQDGDVNLFVVIVPVTRASWESSKIRRSAAARFVSQCRISDNLHLLNFHASCGDLLGKVMFLVSEFEILLTCVEPSL